MAMFNDSMYLAELNRSADSTESSDVIVIGDDRKATVPAGVYNAGVQQDEGSTVLKIQIPLETKEGVDLSLKTIEVKFMNSQKEVYTVLPSTKTINKDGTILLTAPIPYSATKYQGTLYTSIGVYSLDEYRVKVIYYWQSIPFTLTVYRGIINYVPVEEDATILQQVLDRMNSFEPTIEQAELYALRAETAFTKSEAEVVKAKAEVSKATEQANKAANSALDAAQAAGFWTPVESVRELGHLREYTGKTLDIKDTISGPAPSLTLFGDTRVIKPGYTGKNLLRNYATTIQAASTKFTVNSNGSITVVAATTAGNMAYCNLLSVHQSYTLGPGTYTLSSKSTIEGVKLFINVDDVLHSVPYTFTCTKNVSLKQAFIEVPAGVTGTTTVYPQLEAGSVATDYEPYCGAAPAPNPDCPQQIITAGGLCDWDGVLEQGTLNTGTGEPADTSNRVRSTFIRVSPGSTYKILEQHGYRVGMVEYKADKTFAYNDGKWAASPRVQMVTANTEYIRVTFSKTDDATITPAEVTASICPVLRYYTSGKNMLPPGFAKSVTTNGITFKVNPDGSVDVSGTATDTAFLSLTGVGGIPVKKGCVYTIPSWPETLSESSGAYLLAQGYKGSTWLWGLAVHSGADGKIDVNKINSSTENVRLALYVKKGSSANLRVYPQFEFGDSATTYNPPSGEVVDIPLMDEAGNALQPLMEIPGKTRNEIRKDGETWKYYCNVSGFTVDHVAGAEALTNTVRAAITMSIDKWFCGFSNTRANGISNITNWSPSWSSDTEHFYIDSRYFFIFINKSRLSSATLEGMNEYLAANRPIFYAVRNETEKITLHAEAQAALNKLASTYAGRTIITSVDPLPPTLQMTVGAQADKATYSRPESDQRYSNALVREAEGDLINIHTAPAPALDLVVKGKSEQDTTTGKNLLPPGSNGFSKDGITYKKNANGSVSISGTATTTTYYYFPLTQLDVGTYSLSESSNGITMTLKSSLNGVTQWHGGTFNYKDGESILEVYLSILSGTVTNITIYPQLEKGSAATSYEPYTGGMPSPNPDYPQPIMSVGGEIEWDGVLERGSINSTGLASNEKEVRTTNYISVTPSSNYRINANGVDWCNVTEYDVNKNFVTNRQAGWEHFPYTFTTMSNTRYIKVRFGREPYVTITPEDVTGVTICPVINVSCTNSNLITVDSKSMTVSPFTFDYDANTCILTINGELKVNESPRYIIANLVDNTSFRVKLGATYKSTVEYVSGEIEGMFGTYIPIQKPDGSWVGSAGAVINSKTRVERTFTVPETIGAYPNIQISADRNDLSTRVYAKDLKIRIKFEFADASSSGFLPTSAKQSYLSIPLMGTHGNALEPLRKIDTVHDSIVKQGGLWMVKRSIAHVVFDGSQSIGGYSDYDSTRLRFYYNTENAQILKPPADNLDIIVSNKFNDIWTGESIYVSPAGHIFMYVKKSRLKTQDKAGIEDWIRKINPIVYYQLHNPVYEPICDEAQTALNKLAQMYPNQTVITGVDAVSPGFKIKYAADSNYIIEQLTNAVIALGGQI